MISKISGIGLNGIEKKIRQIHKEAFESTDTVLPIGGIYRYRKMVKHINIKVINSLVTKRSWFKLISSLQKIC